MRTIFAAFAAAVIGGFVTLAAWVAFGAWDLAGVTGVIAFLAAMAAFAAVGRAAS